MVHSIIASVLNDENIRKRVLREIVPRHFDDIARYGRYFDDPEGAASFISNAIACAVETGDALSAFVELRLRDENARGSSFDAFEGVFKSFEFVIAAHIAGHAECAGWSGPVRKPRLVEADWGGGVTTFLAVQTADLLPYGMCLTAVMDDGQPDRQEDGTIDWYPLAWHRIRSLGSKRLGFDPGQSGADAYAAQWVASLAAIHAPRPASSADDLDIIPFDLPALVDQGSDPLVGDLAAG